MAIKALPALRCGAGSPSIVIDLTQTAYLDSSALGMLLQLREKASDTKKPVGLMVRAGMVLDVLRVARFERLFDVTEVAAAGPI